MILTISIHTFRVEGDGVHMKKYIEVKISIHTFRVEGDYMTLTSRAGTPHISIHTFRVEGD